MIFLAVKGIRNCISWVKVSLEHFPVPAMPSGVLLLQHFVHTSCCSHLRIILGFRESWAGLALHNWLKSVCVDLHSHFQRGDYVTELILSCFQSFWKTGTLGHLIIHHLQTSSLIHSMIFYPILRYFQDNVGMDKFAAVWGLQAISSCWFYRKSVTLCAWMERGEKFCNFMELPLIWSLLAERASSLCAIASPCCCHGSHCLGSHSWPGQHPCCCW